MVKFSQSGFYIRSGQLRSGQINSGQINNKSHGQGRNFRMCRKEFCPSTHSHFYGSENIFSENSVFFSFLVMC